MPLPIAHSAAGLTAYFLLPKQRHTLSTKKDYLFFLIVLVLSIFPDFDFIPGLLIGKPNHFHHNASHSIVSALLIATTAWFITKAFLNKYSGKALFFVFLTATSSHLFLDFFSSDTSYPYGIPLLWPLSSEYYIASFPFFRDVSRAGDSNAVFFQTLLNENNFWEVILEIVFLLLVICLAYSTKGKKKIFRLAAIASALLVSASFYALQIEPNWIQINNYDITTQVKRNKKIAQISDLHLKNISYRENKLKEILIKDIKPDILVLTGDILDPFGENQKRELSKHTKSLAQYILSLPGEKFLVWGEGITNNRHQLSKFFSSNGVTVLEDETIMSKTVDGLAITGKLPELAYFHLIKKRNNTFLTAAATELNSFLHYSVKDSFQWSDYEFSGEFIFNKNAGGMGLTFYSQYTPQSDQFYRIRWGDQKPRPILSPHGTGSPTGKIASEATLQHDQAYLFKIQVETAVQSTKIQAKFWQTSSEEPTAWNIQAEDTSPHHLRNGTVGVWVSGESGVKLFDNFTITSLSDPKKIFAVEDFENQSLFNQKWQSEPFFINNISPVKNGEINILLAHSPQIINKYKINNFDIIFTGGTHGGQVCWPWGKPIVREINIPPDWYSGLHIFNSQKIYINRGIGTSRLPIRIFCRPELAIFNL